jgi:serine/threonine protein phosphatase 1
MKKTYKFFVVSDVHGEYNAMVQALNEAGYNRENPEHFFVCLGDSFDRGRNSRDIYNFFTRLPKDRSVFVKGNHDCFFEEYLEKGMDGEFVLFNILHNGLGATIDSFGCMNIANFGASMEALEDARGYIVREYPNLLSFIKKMPLWFETDNTILVHAGLNPALPDWQLTDEHYALWDITDAHKRVPSTMKTIIFGHYHADQVFDQAEREGIKAYKVDDHPSLGLPKTLFYSAYGNKDKFGCTVIPNSFKIAIDGCTNLTEKVNVLVFEDTITTPDGEEAPDNKLKAELEEAFSGDMVNDATVRITTTHDWNNIDWAQYTTTAGDIDGAVAHTHMAPYVTYVTRTNEDGTWITVQN